MNQMAKVVEGAITEYELPHTEWIGTSVVQRFHLLPKDILELLGWLPLEDNPPSFNKETQGLQNTGYDIQGDKVVKEYKLFNLEGSESVTNYSMAVMNLVAKSIREDELSDEELQELIDVYPQWKTDEELEGGDYRRYEGNVYQVIEGKGHTTQSDWLPNEQPSLYNKVAPKGVIAEWKQPAGSHDAYQLGDKVTYQGVVYISTHDGGNTWSPEEYGWKLLEGDDK